MTFRISTLVLFATMMAFAAVVVAAIPEKNIEWTGDAMKDDELQKTRSFGGDKADDAPPLPTASVRLMPDQKATKKPPSVVIGMFDADNVTVRYVNGSIVLERPLGQGESENKETIFEAVSPKMVARMKREEGTTVMDENSQGYAPKHLPFRPSMPGQEEGNNDGGLRHVFGSDQRRVYRDTSYPYSTVGRVRFPEGTCTGTMIGPRHVLTAAHCLSTGTSTFTPAYYNGAAPFGTATVINAYHWGLVDTSNGFTQPEVAFDYAVLILDRRMGDSTGYVSYRTYSSSWNGGTYWSNYGYPGGLTRAERPTYTTNGSIDSVELHRIGGLVGMVLGTFIDMEGGHSGGPVWAWFSGESFPRIVGVMSSEATNPSYSTSGDNQIAGGQPLTDLVAYARKNSP